MNNGIQIEGIEEVQKIMKRLPEQFNRKVLNSVGRKAAKPFFNKLKEVAPVSVVGGVFWFGKWRKIPVGYLKESISIRKTKMNDDPGVKVGPSRKKGWWAHFVEFGTAGYTIKKGKNKGRFIPGQKANPFVQPTFEEKKYEVISEYSRNFEEILNKFQKKYGYKK